jgi:hypothetical protein
MPPSIWQRNRKKRGEDGHVLQPFLPLPFYERLVDDSDFNRSPALHDKIDDFVANLATLCEGHNLAATPTDVHSDTFGFASLEILENSGLHDLKSSRQRVRLQRLVIGNTVSGEFTLIAPNSLADLATAGLTIKDSVIRATPPDYSNNSKTTLDNFLVALMKNASAYAAGKLVSCRARYSLPSFNDYLASPFIEFSLATATNTVADEIGRSANTLDDASRTAFAALSLEKQGSESIHFALLPGFSTCRVGGITKPDFDGDGGLALFFLSQFARIAGVIAFLSGNTLVTMGQEKFQRNDWRWERTTRHLNSRPFPGTIVGIYAREDRMRFFSGLRQLSVECVKHFWETTPLLSHSPVSLQRIYHEGSSLEGLYDKYLAAEAAYFLKTPTDDGEEQRLRDLLLASNPHKPKIVSPEKSP